MKGECVHINNQHAIRIYISFALFLLFFSISCTPRSLVRTNDLRFITVCVLNDIQAPVSQEVINDTLSHAFNSYQSHAGIIFTAIEQVSYAGDLTAWDVDQGTYIRDQCPQGEVRIVFSNQTIARKNTTYFNENLFAPSNDEAILGGSAHSAYGFILLYESAKHFAIQKNGESVIFLILRHEIGHLFGLDDIHDANSFMYPFLINSRGLWTNEVTTLLRAHKHTAHWFPPRYPWTQGHGIGPFHAQA